MRQLAVVAVVVALCGQAHAVSLADLSEVKQPNVHWGQLQLSPYYDFAETYDSNIYLVPRDGPNGAHVGGGVLGSWITKNIVGFRGDLPVGRLHHFSGGYEFEGQNYTTQSTTNDNIRQKANFTYDYRGSHGFSGTAKETYVNTTDPAFSELNARAKRWQNQASAVGTYVPRGGPFNAGVDYMDTVDKYLDSSLGAVLNRDSQSAGFKGGYKIQPKTNLFFAYHRGIIHYSVPAAAGTPDKDGKSHSADVGLEGDLLPNLTGVVQTGFHYRRYDVAGANGQTATRNWTYGGQLEYQATKRTTADLSLSRGLQESVSGNSRFYIANDAYLAVKHRLPYKFTAGLNLGLSINKYPEAQTTNGQTANRRDDIYTEGASLDYEIQKWLTAQLSYLHRERNSIFAGAYNYEDHLTTFTLSVKL